MLWLPLGNLEVHRPLSLLRDDLIETEAMALSDTLLDYETDRYGVFVQGSVKLDCL